MRDLNGGQKVGALAVIWLFGAIIFSMLVYGLPSGEAQGWALVIFSVALTVLSFNIVKARGGNADQSEDDDDDDRVVAAKPKRADDDSAALLALLTDEDRAALSASVRQRLVRRLANDAPTDGELGALEAMLANTEARRAQRAR